jgi:hypothetical protein
LRIAVLKYGRYLFPYNFRAFPEEFAVAEQLATIVIPLAAKWLYKLKCSCNGSAYRCPNDDARGAGRVTDVADQLRRRSDPRNVKLR